MTTATKFDYGNSATEWGVNTLEFYPNYYTYCPYPYVSHESKVKISLEDALHLVKASSKDKKLRTILHKLQHILEVEVEFEAD